MTIECTQDTIEVQVNCDQCPTAQKVSVEVDIIQPDAQIKAIKEARRVLHIQGWYSVQGKCNQDFCSSACLREYTAEMN